MGSIGGWNIWTKGGDRVRQFTAAVVDEVEAVALVKAENPDVEEVLSRHPVDVGTIALLGMPSGDITEWVPLDCKQKLPRIAAGCAPPIDRHPDSGQIPDSPAAFLESYRAMVVQMALHVCLASAAQPQTQHNAM